MYEDENGSEDEVVHRTSQEDRILRGKIIPSDDPDFVVIVRRDGEWLIAKNMIITIRRAVRRGAERVAGTLIETVKAQDPRALSPDTRIRVALEANPSATDYEISKLVNLPIQMIERIRRESQ
jgi:hypothetical protein